MRLGGEMRQSWGIILMTPWLGSLACSVQYIAEVEVKVVVPCDQVDDPLATYHIDLYRASEDPSATISGGEEQGEADNLPAVACFPQAAEPDSVGCDEEVRFFFTVPMDSAEPVSIAATSSQEIAPRVVWISGASSLLVELSPTLSTADPWCSLAAECVSPQTRAQDCAGQLGETS